MLAARLQAAVQRGLAESPRAQALCARLAGRSLRIAVAGTPFAVTFDCDGSTLRPRAAAGGDVDVSISGGPLALLALLGTERERVVQRGAASITGDTAIAEQFAALAGLLRPDLEQVLGELVGRAPAHLLAAGAHAVGGWSAGLRDGFLRTAADYMMHERREWLSQPEATHFYGELAALQARTAALQARLARLADGAAPR